MAAQIVVPELGESIVEATVLRWLKADGEQVSAGEPIVELETEKVNLTVAAEQTGVLARIHHKQGEDVKVGDVLGWIEPSPQSVTPDRVPGSRADSSSPAAPGKTPAQNTSEPVESSESQPKDGATPLAGRIAKEYGVDVTQVHATGIGGRVTKVDVENFADQQKSSQPTPSSTTGTSVAAPSPNAPAPSPAVSAGEGGRPEERVRMSRRRQTIARRLVEAQHNAAMLTTFAEVEMSAVMELRKRQKETFKLKYGVSLGITSFFVKAVLSALRAFPKLNAEIQGDEMVLKKYFDIGVAVGAEEGLVVPVLRDADRLSFSEIERQISTLAQKANDNTLSLEDLRGGTFTITNGGVFGSLMSTPILNAPQVGILGLHKIEDRPIALDGQVIIRPMMYVALSYDHRIVDGREAVRFLVQVKEFIQDPASMLLE